MRFPVGGRIGGGFVGALLGFLAVVVAPAEARAGCGGHWYGARAEAFADLSRLELLDPTGPPREMPDGSPTKGPPPCRGALCSGNPAVPTTAAPATVPPVDPRVAVGLSIERDARVGSFPYAERGEGVRPTDRAEAIFHPPPRADRASVAR